MPVRTGTHGESRPRSATISLSVQQHGVRFPSSPPYSACDGNHDGCRYPRCVARRTSSEPRPRGTIRRHGNSLQVIVYAGLDPVTGKRMYLRGSTTDEAEAERILTRFRAQVDEQRVIPIGLCVGLATRQQAEGPFRELGKDHRPQNGSVRAVAVPMTAPLHPPPGAGPADAPRTSLAAMLARDISAVLTEQYQGHGSSSCVPLSDPAERDVVRHVQRVRLPQRCCLPNTSFTSSFNAVVGSSSGCRARRAIASS